MGKGDFVWWPGGGGGGGGGSAAAVQIGGNTSGTTALVSSGTLTLVGGNNVTLSQVGNAITISVPNTSSQTVQTQGVATLSQFYPNMQGGTITRQFGQSTVHVEPLYAPAYVSGSRAHVLLSVSLSTSSNSSHAGALSYAIGIYTQNVSTLSLASSGSTNYVWTNTSNNSTASLQSFKVLSIPLDMSLNPNSSYWIGHLSYTASTNANWITLSNVLAGVTAYSGSFASGSTGTTNNALGLGHWSVQTASLPDSMAFADLRNNAPQDQNYAMITFMNTTV